MSCRNWRGRERRRQTQRVVSKTKYLGRHQSTPVPSWTADASWQTPIGEILQIHFTHSNRQDESYGPSREVSDCWGSCSVSLIGHLLRYPALPLAGPDSAGDLRPRIARAPFQNKVCCAAFSDHHMGRVWLRPLVLRVITTHGSLYPVYATLVRIEERILQSNV